MRPGRNVAVALGAMLVLIGLERLVSEHLAGGGPGNLSIRGAFSLVAIPLGVLVILIGLCRRSPHRPAGR